MFTACHCAKCYVLHSFAALSHSVQSVTGVLHDSAWQLGGYAFDVTFVCENGWLASVKESQTSKRLLIKRISY